MAEVFEKCGSADCMLIEELSNLVSVPWCDFLVKPFQIYGQKIRFIEANARSFIAV